MTKQHQTLSYKTENQTEPLAMPISFGIVIESKTCMLHKETREKAQNNKKSQWQCQWACHSGLDVAKVAANYDPAYCCLTLSTRAHNYAQRQTMQT